MGKNVAVFVDVANIFYAAKAAGVDIDYVTLLRSASAGRDLVRAYAYTGLDPDNENQRNFHDFLRRSNYKVVSKDIRKYGDGKVKANLDIELVVDMMKTARNLDIAIVVSGDGDFAPAIRAVQEQGVRVEVISFRGNTSSDLIEVADQFTDIVQLARVEKGSRSGRRVAEGDDLSMTEVPDKQTEGTGLGRGGRGGRGRGRSGRYGDAEPVAAGSSRGRGIRGVRAAAVSEPEDAGLLALPGERLSKAVGSLTEADLAAAEVFTLDALDDTARGDRDGALAPLDRGEDEPGEGGRRRRRRGGRGRGRGRNREDGAPEGATPAVEIDADDIAAAAFEATLDEPDVEDEAPRREAVAPTRPRTTPFGSVWDSQLGTPAAPTAASLAPLADDEDFDEPEIPEYLIAEQRRGQQGGRGGAAGRGGARGGRSAYQSAMERERYGRGGGGGINRYPDVSGRTNARPAGPAPREDRAPRPERDRQQRPERDRDDRPGEGAPRSSSEPWSEVPPELEAMLRAQVAQKPAAAAPERSPRPATEASDATASTVEAVPATAPKRRSTRAAKAVTADEAPVVEAVADVAPAKAAPKARAPRTTTTRTTRASKAAAADGTTDAVADAEAVAEADAASATVPKRRATRSPRVSAATEPAADAATAGDAAEIAAPAAPKRRAPRKAATPGESA